VKQSPEKKSILIRVTVTSVTFKHNVALCLYCTHMHAAQPLLTLFECSQLEVPLARTCAKSGCIALKVTSNMLHCAHVALAQHSLAEN